MENTDNGQQGNQQAENTETTQGTPEGEAQEGSQDGASVGTSQGEGATAEDAPSMKEMYEQAMKRNDELAEQLATLLDSVGKLIESGAAFGRGEGAEPQKRNPSPDDKKLDAIMKGVKNANQAK